MIIYDHVPVLLRLIQYKGTVLVDTALHLILVNLVVVLVLLFSEGGWLTGSDRPEWMPAPFFSTDGPVSPTAWQMLIVPLGFLLGVRSNQAYERWSSGVDSYTRCINAASELCRQASSYVKMDVEGGSGEGPNWQYRNVPSGVWPEPGQNDYEDPDKERLFRHSLAFLAMVRQDIRKRRIVDNEDREAVIRRATEDRLHVTEEELQHLVDSGVYSPDVNGPLVVARWLSHDVAALSHRISFPTIVAAMESNIGNMVDAFHQIDKISDHPVPWPYTHLTQVFLIFWVYTLPLAMAPVYQGGTFFIVTAMAIILFGLDAVAREIQDPFGFDDNDLNVQGYELTLMRNADASIDGPLKVRCRDFASKTTHLRTSMGDTFMDGHIHGKAELMAVPELQAGFESRENLTSLTNIPWITHGTFQDKILSSKARKVNGTELKLKTRQYMDELLQADFNKAKQRLVTEDTGPANPVFSYQATIDTEDDK